MEISDNALDLIKHSEGLVLNAYRDPVGIPTIGWGTIAYPNGRRVQMGDSISAAEADAFLKFDCEQVASGVDEVINPVKLNQNQFDALVSFSYNLGVGALMSSTLIKKLKAGDFAGAADEFPRWNKGVQNGIKVELPGLTKRRAAERALFLKTAGFGKPQAPAGSDVEAAVLARAYNSDGATYLAAFNAGGKAVEILQFQDNSPLTIIAALKTYPNLASFEAAPAGAVLPAGDPVLFTGLSQEIPKSKKAPKMTRDLLVYGMEDTEVPPSDDIRNLQTRLIELGYYDGPVDGLFGLLTDRASRQFQADYFGRSEADGRVGKATWAKLWGESKPTNPGGGHAAPGKNYLSLTKNNAKDEYGCYLLTLAYFKNGAFAGSIDVCSGQPRKQIFRSGQDSPRGSLEPIPEGKWKIGDIDWCAGKDNYGGSVWNSGLGPAKILLDFAGPGTTARQAIEVHIDWNRANAPGTAGCIGVLNVSDFRTLVGWLRDTDPRELYVDWNLGTCPAP